MKAKRLWLTLSTLLVSAACSRQAVPTPPSQPAAAPAPVAAAEPPPPSKYDPAEFRTVVGPPCERRDTAPSVGSRTDSGLSKRYSEYVREGGKPGQAIAVEMRFCGELAPILDLGVEINGPVWESGTMGVVVKYADLPRIVEHPHVVWLAAGSPASID